MEKHAAAVSSNLAAELYGLDILAEHIEDSAENTTRFLVIGRQDPKPTGDDKTSICYAIKDKVGALFETLLPFKEEKVTLTMIESRPTRRKNWEYCFFVDFMGHAEDKISQRVLAKLREHCQFVRVLGSYPRANDLP
jgi:chorismate mutase/prephenate dehydratase